MCLNIPQLKDLIERILKEMDLDRPSNHNPFYSPQAVTLLLGTYAKESIIGGETHLRQIKGPARSPFMIEPDTFVWLQHRYAEDFPYLKGRRFDELEWDLKLGIMYARLKYYSVPHPIPAENDLSAFAAYWDTYYNCNALRGTVEEFIQHYEDYVA